MRKLSKRMSTVRNCIDSLTQYNISEGLKLLQKTVYTKFVESVDASINLGINTRKSDQNVRGNVVMPYGIGKSVRIAVFAQGDDVDKIKKEGIDLVGLEDLSSHIKSNGCNNIDVILASSNVMNVVGKLGSILGPRGLMPNPKMGTVSNNVLESVRNIKSGQVRYKNDKNGIIHLTIGKINFDVMHLQKNLEAAIISIKQSKPTQYKGEYIKKIFISSTMGGSVWIDKNSLDVLISS